MNWTGISSDWRRRPAGRCKQMTTFLQRRCKQMTTFLQRSRECCASGFAGCWRWRRKRRARAMGMRCADDGAWRLHERMEQTMTMESAAATVMPRRLECDGARMATEGNGRLGLSEEERGGQLMDPALECVDASLMEDSTQNPDPWLESNSSGHALEEFELLAKPSPALVGGSEQIQEPDRKILQLRFETSMPDHFFVGKKVKGRDGAICVKLIDTTTGYVVTSGPLSSLTLDVVVLAGDFNNKYDDDWTWEQFNSKLELSRPGKGPLLEGDLQVLLKEGVGCLAEFKITDISTCRPSGKFRLGVKVEPGFFEGIRIREAKTDAFEVQHFEKESEEKHVPRKLGDDVCLLMGIGKNGAFPHNLKNAGIFKVEDFLWKLGLDPEGLKIVGKTMSAKNRETLGDHAKKSVPRGKFHDTENSGIVFKNMSELFFLIEDGKYYLAENLLDGQKESALKKVAGDKGKAIEEYVGSLQSEMTPSKRAHSSQTDVVIGAPESCPPGIDLASSLYVDPPVNPGLAVGAALPGLPPSVSSGEASKSSMPDSVGLDALWRIPARSDSYLLGSSLDPPEQAGGNTVLSVGGYGDSFEQGKQLGGSNSPRNEERMKYSGGNANSPGVCVIFDVNLGFGKTYNSGGGGGGGGAAAIK